MWIHYVVQTKYYTNTGAENGKGNSWCVNVIIAWLVVDSASVNLCILIWVWYSKATGLEALGEHFLREGQAAECQAPQQEVESSLQVGHPHHHLTLPLRLWRGKMWHVFIENN